MQCTEPFESLEDLCMFPIWIVIEENLLVKIKCHIFSCRNFYPYFRTKKQGKNPIVQRPSITNRFIVEINTLVHSTPTPIRVQQKWVSSDTHFFALEIRTKVLGARVEGGKGDVPARGKIPSFIPTLWCGFHRSW